MREANSRWMCSSYSRPSRRSPSSTTTSSTTPMHVAAKAPWLVMCHDDDRKHASIVYQFQSICAAQQAVSISFFFFLFFLP